MSVSGGVVEVQSSGEENLFTEGLIAKKIAWTAVLIFPIVC